MKNNLCRECGKRALCSSLCPEAELYVNQDEVKQREKTIGCPRYGRMPNRIWNVPVNPNLTLKDAEKLQRKLRSYVRLMKKKTKYRKAE